MKKRLKKLTLNRETLRDLSHRDAKAVLGAASYDTSCRCRIQTGCDCETQGCTITCQPACYSIGCSG
jgi:hypothetical protein